MPKITIAADDMSDHHERCNERIDHAARCTCARERTWDRNRRAAQAREDAAYLAALKANPGRCPRCGAPGYGTRDARCRHL